MKTLIKVNDLAFAYGQQPVLENIGFSIKEGEFAVIIGPNGSGKSTLMKILIGQLTPQQGSVQFAPSLASDQIGYVSQAASHQVQKGFPATVREVVASGLVGKLGLFGRMNRSDWLQIDQVLKQVGLLDWKERNIENLSGGQRQRVFIARALVSKPKLLFLDEPTVGVDVEAKKSLYQLLANLKQTKRLTILLVTHDLEMIPQETDQIICLNREILFKGSRSAFAKHENQLLAALFWGRKKEGENHF